MKIEQMSLEDFCEISENLKAFWGDRHHILGPQHHPIVIHEFGKTAYVIRDGDHVAAYLMGMLPYTSDTAYVHLIAVKPEFRKTNYGKALYDHFIAFARLLNFKKVKAITRPDNILSITFHRKIGMQLLGEENEDGIPVVKDYAGQGEDRVVFEREL